MAGSAPVPPATSASVESGFPSGGWERKDDRPSPPPSRTSSVRRLVGLPIACQGSPNRSAA
ncbi:hypothetical protein [Alienimonas sp. DA493]|uniref:hypothetical protein n=1 Tax=Alienimonas sp. DA493 TaxID=3373605 RepID=UPI0037546075